MPEATSQFRLPKHTRPERYEVVLEPDLPAATFRGTVKMQVNTALSDANSGGVPITDFVLNAIELEIEHCSVDGASAAWELDPERERLTITPSTSSISDGPHTIDVGFRGTLNDQLRGWYRSTFTDDSGVTHTIATSQMQATDCRRVFPCWDEPEFKAVFGVTLIVDQTLMAVSNGAELERHELEGGRVSIRFADTMPMSSYLVAVVVGPLDATPWREVDGIPVRIVHRPGQDGLTEFGHEVAAFSLRWYQDYYGIAYPTDKLDLLALPDFAAGAMENLGCVTFREYLLLVDPNTATTAERQVVVDVVAHELAHMWFGDLVTMSWWNGIWLNEAFATFMEIAACDAFRPEWERWTSFGIERTVAFDVDSLSSTRPVEYHVESPAEADGMFDVLTYQKGGALLRMLEQFLGADIFRRGVNRYLREHAYGNTEASDLWSALEAEANVPVRAIMDSWIWQAGYPLIQATIVTNQDGSELVFRQHRFAYVPSSPDANEATVWSVPVMYRVGDIDGTLLLDGTEARVPLRLADADSTVVVNAGGHGFYRVAYSDDLLARFTPASIAHLTTLERYCLVDDAWNAVVADRLTPASYVSLLDRFLDERDPSVWQAMGNGMRSLGRLVEREGPGREAFQTWVRSLAAPALADLGEPAVDESDLTAQLRGLLLSLVAVLGNDHAARARARELITHVSVGASANETDPDLIAAATNVVAAIGDDADYRAFVDIAVTSDNPQLKLRHLNALPEFPDAAHMAETLELLISDRVRTQDAPFTLARCIAHRDHGMMAWEFVKQHWDDAVSRFPRSAVPRMLNAVRFLDTDAAVADVAAFLAAHPVEQGAKSIEQTLERQRINAALRTRVADSIGSIFTR